MTTTNEVQGSRCCVYVVRVHLGASPAQRAPAMTHCHHASLRRRSALAPPSRAGPTMHAFAPMVFDSPWLDWLSRHARPPPRRFGLPPSRPTAPAYHTRHQHCVSYQRTVCAIWIAPRCSRAQSTLSVRKKGGGGVRRQKTEDTPQASKGTVHVCKSGRRLWGAWLTLSRLVCAEDFISSHPARPRSACQRSRHITAQHSTPSQPDRQTQSSHSQSDLTPQ